METQGWPLFAVRRASGQIYAVVGWRHSAALQGSQAIGVELNAELVAGQALVLGDGFTFVAELGDARNLAARARDER